MRTPGPWRIGGELITTVASPCVEIATVHGRWKERPDAPVQAEADANARAIAGLPELLEAARPLLGWAREMSRDSSDPGTKEYGLRLVGALQSALRACGEEV